MKIAFYALVVILAFSLSLPIACSRETEKVAETPPKVEPEPMRVAPLITEDKPAPAQTEKKPAAVEKKTVETFPAESCEKPAPSFALKDLTGNSVSLSDFAGKVVILDFWATWCRPCRMEIPSFIELQNTYGKDGLIIVGLSLDRNPGVLPGFIQKTGINYPILHDNGNRVAIAYGNVSSIPTTFIIDRNGCLKEKFVGVHPKSTFERAIRPLLAEKGNAKET